MRNDVLRNTVTPETPKHQTKIIGLKNPKIKKILGDDKHVLNGNYKKP